MIATARNLHRYRELLATLTTRELKARYRGSVLGFLWSLVNPLMLLSVYTFVFGVIFRPRLPHTDPYALFLITGLFPWIWASSSLLEGAMSLTANAGLIRKAVFPIEVLPLVAVLANLVHLLLALPVMAAALVAGRFLGYDVGGMSCWLLPVPVALELLMLAGAALGLAALSVHFKDVRDIVANLLTLLFFLAPILYSLDDIPVPAVRTLIRLNPFTPFTVAYHDLLFFGRVPDASIWLQMAILAVAGWGLGTWLFGRLSETVAEAV